jgi:F-type H+-transporting ATPase subunit alpha
MTELLKQPQLAPQPVEDQVSVIYAAGKGFLDNIPTSRVQEWSNGFTAFAHEKHPNVTGTIAKTSQLSDDTAKALEAAIVEFNRSF